MTHRFPGKAANQISFIPFMTTSSSTTKIGTKKKTALLTNGNFNADNFHQPLVNAEAWNGNLNLQTFSCRCGYYVFSVWVLEEKKGMAINFQC